MTQNESRSNGATNPELELSKLQALPQEQQDIYLLNFVTSLTKHVESLDADDCTSQQFYLKKELLQIINLPAPPPTRLVRNNVGRCLAYVFEKGDRKLLFETVNDLIGLVASSKGKSDAELRTKTAAAHCLGQVFASAGDSAIGLHPLACLTLLKQLKTATNNTGYRSTIFAAFARIVSMIGHSTDENVAKDVWKQARAYASSDKSGLVQISACRCLESLAEFTPYFSNSSDYDNVKSTIFKTLESPFSAVRGAGASCLASILVKSHSESSTVDTNEAPKKVRRTNTKKNMEDDDEELQRPESPSPKKSSVLSFSLMDMLRQLSAQYVKMSASNRARSGLAICYSEIMKGLGQKVVEAQYLNIADHLMCELLSHSYIGNNRYRLLITRRFVQVILKDVIGRQILGESGQIAAAKLLINDILKNYPQALKERAEPTKHTLIASLDALTCLISILGSASNSFGDICRDGLLQVIQHPSYTVQIYASRCLRAFTLACPQQLLPCLTICMNSVSRELNNLGSGRNAPRRCIGYANALSAMISTSPLQPLYGSVDVYSRVLSLATGLLKNSGKSELRTSSTQIQVAWILIGGLMSLGPNFVKIHLSQLLLLWKNALPKPLAKDNTSQRTYLEASFLTHVRECALGSILAFLQFNSRLLTTDVSKRIAAMLQNTSAYLKNLPSKKTTEDLQSRLFPALQLLDLDLMVQRRVLQCYNSLVILSPASGSEALLQSNLLTLAISFFADPDNYVPSSLSTSIATSASNFESLWDVGDNCGFGVNGLVRGFELYGLPGSQDKELRRSRTRNDYESLINAVLESPICASFEHDSLSLYVHDLDISERAPDPPATELVNIAIKLFSIAFPLTSARIQESILEQVATFLSTSSLQREPGRRAALNVNVALALLYTLKVASKETTSPPGDLTNSAVQKTMQEMLRDFAIQPDRYLRHIGYEALGRLCSIAGNAFTNQEIKHLVDTIVANREPSVRAGCAMALGSIHSQVGGMAASFHLKTILGVLMSLCNDPNPTVHVWALEGLAHIIDSAGLTFSGYAASTLALLGQLYVGDCHNAEIASQANSNLELDVQTTKVIARCVDSLVNVLGPDLADMSKARELILVFVEQLQKEPNPAVLAESLRCLGNFSLYAPGHLNFTDYINLLQLYMQSSIVNVRDLAIDGLYSLMKRNAKDVIASAKPGLEDQMWLVLDSTPEHEGIRNLLQNWLQQSCIVETASWLQRCQRVLTMTKTSPGGPPVVTSKKTNMPDLQDEEVAGFAGGSDKDGAISDNTQGQEPLRWQVRTFAMSCLGDIFTLVSKDTSTNGPGPAEQLLQQKVADVIRMAFSASTSNVVELRVWGLKIIDQVLRMFGKLPDPDFPEAALLEQYQAQISSALTPAFAADSSPRLAAEAVNVCAAFIATGIVTDVDRMGRILKTLETALENFSTESETAAIGELKGLSSNAQVMVKMAVFSAWAELQVASSEQQYLVSVLKPHIAALTPLWLASLREFARLRFEPDISMSLGPPSLSGSLDSIYSALNRETLLKFYQDSWLKLVDAIASLIEQDSEFVFDALDGKDPDVTTSNGNTNDRAKHNDINYRDEPVAFFFVLFGIAFEALASKPGNEVLATREQNLAILLALKKILHPNVSGHAIYREAIFSETMDLLDRLVLIEGLDVQSVIVQIARDLCISHPSARRREDLDDDLSEDIEQLFELTRIIVLVLAGLIPNLTDAKQATRQLTEEAVSLIRVSLNALVDAAEVFPAIIKTDLHACIVHIFATILGTGSCQATIVPLSLPILKRFISNITVTIKPSIDKTTRTQIQGCLKRFLSIYTQAQKREAESSLQCVKNALLAGTVVLTSGTNPLGISDSAVVKYMDELLDCLNDRMTAKVASSCIRSLLLQPNKSPASNSLCKYLVPRLVHFVTTTSPEDPERARSSVTSSLTNWSTTLPTTSLPAGMALLVPTLLSRASTENGGEQADNAAIYHEISARLLELAAADQVAFKNLVSSMNSEQKSFMERVIRSGRPSVGDDARAGDDEGSGIPTIALRMNFGGP